MAKPQIPRATKERFRLPGDRRARLAVLLLVPLFAIAFARALAIRLTDWLWFQEVGFERVFALKVAAQWSIGVAAGLVAYIVLRANARVALSGIEMVRDSVRVLAAGGLVMRERLLVRLVQLLAPIVTALATLAVALGAATEWRTVLQFWYRTPFGEVDPVFGRDIAFYVFTLPAIGLGVDLLTEVLIVALVLLVLPIYIARGDIYFRGWRMKAEPGVHLHLAVLTALLLLVHAVRIAFVATPSILLRQHSILTGADLTDLTIRLPAMRLLAVLLVLGSVAILWGARRRLIVRTASATIGAYIALNLLLTQLIPSAYHRLVVQPNELAREAPQLERHIAATRRAWGLGDVERRELDGSQQLTARDLEANRETIENVRLWDRGPLLRTFGQLQSIRTYYEFVGVDDDRYVVDGRLRHVLLSVRELDAAALPTRTFVNEHLTFTHGMGLTMGPTNEITAEGLPVLWVKDLPPESGIALPITRPQIYFGELAGEFVLAPSRQREFDHPSAEGDEAIYSRYEGAAGVPVSSAWRRLLFALRFRSLNILLSRDLTDSTRILFDRNVRRRAAKALPFLRFDGDPYLVVTDSGRLVWMHDAYTFTDRFPYSARLLDGTNYMRNSVKVTIDAYDGDIRAYLSDPADPMIRTLARIYPGLLRPMADMPDDLRAHVRYPERLFNAQTALYATFHMTDPETFYHREDQWQVPRTPQGAEETGYTRHIVMRLPGEARAEYLLMRPFTPRQKDNLAAWVVVRNDGEDYGKLIEYRFPRQSLIFGPAQVASRINQDTEVARQVSLWDRSGSQVIRGELLVIPIESSLLYVQPLYLQAQGGRIPELKRVIVAYEGRVVMEETLDRGLDVLFGGGTSARGATDAPPRPESPREEPSGAAATRAQLAAEALAHYDRARAAQRADDWATYGREMQALGEVLRRLRELDTPRE